METFKSRLQKGQINEAEWQELYILTRHWKEDLDFYREDLQFLQQLINRYSIWIKSTENSKAANTLLADLHRLTNDSKLLLKKIDQHLEQLSSMMQGNKGINTEDILQDQENLENSIAEFIKEFRTNRKQVYMVSEKIMDSEDLSDYNEE